MVGIRLLRSVTIGCFVLLEISWVGRICWRLTGPMGVPLVEVPMARPSIRERPDREEVLWPVQKACPACGQPMRLRYDNRRTLVTLAGPIRLCLKIRRCERVECSRHHRPYRPEAESAIALPEHEFGLDVV